MIVYFADRQFNILGLASTDLPSGLVLTKDTKAEDVDSGVAIFECKVHFDSSTRAKVEECTEVGNFILRKHEREESELYTIIDAEIDTDKQTVYIYAEDAGLDLLNEYVGEYQADKAYPIEHYIEKFAYDSGFSIGINEASGLTRKLSWDSEATVTARLASVATQFDGCEISYSFDVRGLRIVNRFINIHKERGKDIGVTLYLNKEIDNIVIKKTIANTATALRCTGGTPENAEEPITLRGYAYDDGDFYVDGDCLKSRKALEKWSRYINPDEPNQREGHEGHIVKLYSYDTTEQSTLCAHAITELKSICDKEVNYEAEILSLPENVGIGDRINIVDESGELYLSTRILQLERSVVDDEYKAVLGEFLIKGSGISQKVLELAEKHAKTAKSAAQALAIAKNAKGMAESAQQSAESASASATNAQKKAEEAQAASQTATQSAETAQNAANSAQQAVETVENSVSGLETTVQNAKDAADNAWSAAQTAKEKADEAEREAAQAKADAADAKANVTIAQSAAEVATTQAQAAKQEAEAAKAEADNAKATAQAAKIDAQRAQEDIDSLGDNLETVSQTMEAEYARKTDLSEAEASLSSKIEQNAGLLSLTVGLFSVIDETKNNAQEQAERAQLRADKAREEADAAALKAQEAQAAAQEAAEAAQSAQTAADNAYTAYTEAKTLADQAEADLEAALADLESVSSRADATDAEIAAAEQAVETAQAAANKAKADAEAALNVSAAAKAQADTAKAEADSASDQAQTAAQFAALAESVAGEAENAAAAQATASEATQAASNAAQTANKAVTDAANAKAAADKAAKDAVYAAAASEEADRVAAEAAANLVAAKQRLAEVLAKVNPTAEEVRAAQEAVSIAQDEANEALEHATKAAAAAAQANIDAATAQSVADAAQKAADDALAAAEAAQKAADEAQDAVNQLEVRVTDSEASIKVLQDRIKSTVTETQLSQTLGGYYTRGETESLVEQTAGGITSTVKQDIKSIKIGARNLLLNSRAMQGNNISGHGTIASEKYDELSVRTYDNTAATSGYKTVVQFENIYNYMPGKEHTLSFWAKGSGELATYFNGPQGYVPVTNVVQSTGAESTNADGDSRWQLTENWQRYSVTWTLAEKGGITLPKYVLFRVFYGNSASVCGVKLEQGNKASDWTPAPEDGEQATANAQTTADEASRLAGENQERAEWAESQITQLAKIIASLVVDQNGGSLMTQTDDGWTFNIGQFSQKLDGTADSVETLDELIAAAGEDIDALKQSLQELGVLDDYVYLATYNGQPCIELGERSNEFKLRITNTEIQFADGTTIPAYITNKKLMIENAEVKSELQFGGFAWKARSNGNMGIFWKVPIVITSQPQNYTGAAGDTATFSVTASGDDISYQWQALTSSGAEWKNSSFTGNKTRTLSAPITTARNGYQFRCVITDKHGYSLASNAATLTVG